MHHRLFHVLALALVALLPAPLRALAQPTVSVIANDGWARNSVNTTSFRRDSIVTHIAGERAWQVVGYYDAQGRVCLAERELDLADLTNADPGAWAVRVTQHTGNTRDAHNGISLAIDGDGVLHMSWDHHGHALRYARAAEPFSTRLGDREPMLGVTEGAVTYPQFLSLPNGRLLFLYRDGSSGNGNLVINRFTPGPNRTPGRWERLHDVLIDGEGERNAYWQAAVDADGRVHVSWNWRETGDVATNHDLAYAVSDDAGNTWRRTDGSVYAVPINQASAEVALRIPQGHELINQTSMATDAFGRPYIATYFRDTGSDVPQYRLVCHDGEAWRALQVGTRTQAFTLSGNGTKRIPIARPQVLVRPATDPGEVGVLVVVRDAERGNGVTIARCENVHADAMTPDDWVMMDVHPHDVGQWEPSFDHALGRRGVLHVFLQRVEQADHEGDTETSPTPVGVLQWVPDSGPVGG